MRKYDLYTVPGGGVEDKEALESALEREMMEETGYRGTIIAELGEIHEERARHNFRQISYYTNPNPKCVYQTVSFPPGLRLKALC